MRLQIILTVIAAILVPTAAEAAFAHPGLLNDKFELDFMKRQVAAGLQPWKGAFDKMKASGYGSLNYKASPRAVISCGSGGSADLGCAQETEDSHAAYTQALLWAISGDVRYAQKCAGILDAYANTVTGHAGSNAPLQIGWTGGGFIRAAEILRYTYPQWDKSQIDKFSRTMNTAYLPLIESFAKYGFNGNWDAVMIEVMICLAVFDDNQRLFDASVARYKKRTPAYIYDASDGPVPVKPDPSLAKDIVTFWYGQKVYRNGLSQETCRDLRHVQHGFGGLIQTAEVAWHQGVDLYSLFGNRLLEGLEFHAQYVLGAKAPADLCGGNVTGTEAMPTWEIAYNHYHNRKRLEMPRSGQVIAKNSPEDVVQHMMWGTVTHHGVGLEETTALIAPGRVGEPLQAMSRARAIPGLYRAGEKIVDLRGRIFRR